MAASEESEMIANEAALEAFLKAPAEQRQLTAELKGVLAETACTGTKLLLKPYKTCRPLIEFFTA
jgi:hypothetical protein